ncbi:MAG: hypothetical protein ACJ8C4_05245 [Gemmataceae bacterium]
MARRKPCRFFPRTLRLLPLEDRITPSVTSTFDDVTGQLTVSSNGSDSIQIGTDQFSNLTVNGTNFITSTGLSVAARSVRAIEVNGGPGPNVIDLSAVTPLNFGLAINPDSQEIDLTSDRHSASKSIIQNIRGRINGGGGADTITGSQCGDYIECTAGADVVHTGRGNNTILITNDDVSGLTIYGNGFGNDEMFLAYKPKSGKVIACDFDVATGNQTVSYDGKTLVVSGISSVNVQDALDELSMHLFDSSSGVPGGGVGSGTVTIEQSLGSDVSTIDISPPDSTAKTVPGRLKWQIINLKRGITSSMDAWKWRADPSSEPLDIQCTGAGNTLSVNTFGYTAFTSGIGTSISGYQPITDTGMSSVTTHNMIYGSAAMADLAAHGVTIATDTVHAADGSVTNSVTLVNASSTAITNMSLSFDTSSEQRTTTRQDFGQAKPRRPRDVALSLHPSSSSGATVIAIDDMASAPRRAADLAMGISPPQLVTFTMPDLAGGQSITNSLSREYFPRNSYPAGHWTLDVTYGGRECRVYLESRFEDGDIPTGQDFANLIDSVNGHPPTGGASTLLTTDATGLITLSSSSASGIDPNVTTMSAGAHLYVANRMVDIAPDGHTSGNGVTGKAEMSLDGRWVCFESSATNLVAGLSDTNSGTDIFMRDTWLGRTYCLSAYVSGTGTLTTGNFGSFDPHISGDGQFAIYQSSATNLIAGLSDNNDEPDLYKVRPIQHWDSVDNQCVSVVPGLVPSQTCNKGVIVADMNGDGYAGYTIAYVTDATNAGAPPTPGWHVAEFIQGYPVKWEGPAVTGSFTGGLTVSLDGSNVVLWTATNLSNMVGIPDTNGSRDVVLINATTGAVTPLSTNFAHTAMADGASPAGTTNDAPAMSIDGSHVAFSSSASNLISGIASPASDGMYRYVLKAGVPLSSERLDTIGASSWGSNNRAPSLSGTGFTCVWSSPTDYATAGPGNGKIQNWVKDCYDGKDNRRPSICISVSETNQPGDSNAKRGILGSTGDCLDFSTDATNIVAGDTNGFEDVFTTSRHHSYTFQLSVSTTTAVTVAYDAPTNSVVVKDAQGAVVASQSVTFAFPGTTLFIYGRDGVDDQITIDMSSGLDRLGGDINVFGGTGNDRLIAFALPGQCASTRIVGGAHDASSIEGFQLTATGTFSDGTTRDITNERFSIRCLSMDTIEDKTYSANVIIQTLDPTTSITKIGKNTKVTTGSFSTEPVFPLVVGNRLVQVILTPGNDSCTINTAAITPGDAENLQVFGNGGVDTMTTAGSATLTHSGYLLDGNDAPVNASATLQGGAGNDTLVLGPGVAAMNGGAGDDVYMFNAKYKLFSVTGQPEPVGDASGNDRLDFSHAGVGVTVNTDSSAVQTFAPGCDLQLSGQFENATGSPLDDFFIIKGLSVPRSIDGGGQVSGPGDRLVVDAQGHAATVLHPGDLRIQSFAPISYTGIEDLVVINQAPTLQVASVQINDGSTQRSRVYSLTVGFNGHVDFPNGTAAAFQLTNNVSGNSYPLIASKIDNAGFTVVTLTFAPGSPNFGSLPAGAYTLKVIGGQLTSPLGGLDGNADGVVAPGGETYFTPDAMIFCLFGDGNGDRTVDQNDYLLFRNAVAGGVNIAYDSNQDSDVDQTDYLLFRNNIGAIV